MLAMLSHLSVDIPSQSDEPSELTPSEQLASVNSGFTEFQYSSVWNLPIAEGNAFIMSIVGSLHVFHTFTANINIPSIAKDFIFSSFPSKARKQKRVWTCGCSERNWNISNGYYIPPVWAFKLYNIKVIQHQETTSPLLLRHGKVCKVCSWCCRFLGTW